MHEEQRVYGRISHLYANDLIREEREKLLAMADTLKKNGNLDSQRLTLLGKMVERYEAKTTDTAGRLEELMEKIDTIPPSLALGQTAYESGYGTSRFAVEGNALFGQWTFGGKGMKPKEYRAGSDWYSGSVSRFLHGL